MAMAESKFAPLDFIVFFATIGFSLSIGIYFAIKDRNKKTLDNYFLADRKSSVIPTALSLLVSFQSSIVVIGAPAEVYTYGLVNGYLVIPMGLSFVFAAFTIVPVLHPLKLTSVYQYFPLRYHDNAIRYFAFALGFIYFVLYMGSVIYGTCAALEIVIGIPHWATILIYTVVTATYTSVGGMKAVIWTDVFQLVVMVTGALAIIIKSAIVVGGVGDMFDIATTRINMNDFRIDPRIRYQFWNTTTAAFTAYLVSSLQQPSVQRINCTRTLTEARRIYIVAGLLTVVFTFLVSFEGVAIYAFYSSLGCDPLASGRIDHLNQLVPTAVMDLFSSLPGLSGLFIATLSCAALSTLSSCMSSLGAVTYEDIIREKFPDIPEDRATTYSKVIVLMYGLSALGISFLLSIFPGSILSVFFAFVGCLDGPTCAIFFLSLFYKGSTTKGVLIGAITGMAVVLWINIGQLLGYGQGSPALPPAPIDNCTHLTNTTSTALSIFQNNSMLTTAQDMLVTSTSTKTFANYTMVTTTQGAMAGNSSMDVTFVQQIYSISFTCFSLIGCLVSVTVAVLISLCTSPPSDVDEKYMFSFRKHVCEAFFVNSSEEQSDGVKEDFVLQDESKGNTARDGETDGLMNDETRA